MGLQTNHYILRLIVSSFIYLNMNVFCFFKETSRGIIMYFFIYFFVQSQPHACSFSYSHYLNLNQTI